MHKKTHIILATTIAASIVFFGAFGLWLKHRTDWLLHELPRQSANNIDSLNEFVSYVATLERRLYLAEEDTALLKAAVAKGAKVAIPAENAVYQQRDGSAKVQVEILATAPTHSTITNADNHVVSKETATRYNITLPIGWYKLCVTVEGAAECNRFGVGDVFIVAGQSNAASMTEQPIRSETGNVSVTPLRREKTFIDPATHPVKESAAWVFAGDDLATRLKRPVAFINVAKGATTSQDWLPEQLYFSILRETLTRYEAKAVLWHQGESDCNQHFTTEQSLENLKTIISTAKAVRNIPWLVALNTLSTDRACPVRIAQQTIIDQGIALSGPDTDTLPKTNEHFQGEDLRRHGLMWSDFIRRHFSDR